MKISKSEIHWKARALPEMRFEGEQLTSFAGLVVLQIWFERLGIKSCLRGRLEHLNVSQVFGRASLVMLLLMHLLIGYRRLSDLPYYQDDPMVRRTLGLKRLPDVATGSRKPDGIDQTAVRELPSRSRSLVLERLKVLAPARLPGNVDGSVICLTRMVEGTAVGYSRRKLRTLDERDALA